jgi:Short C-terminal domain
MVIYTLCRFRKVVASTLICTLSFAAPAQASPKSELKDQAKKTLLDMRAAGAPQNRCSLGTNLGEGYVLKTYGKFISGDQLLYLNNLDVSVSKDDGIINILNSITPDATIPVRVKRDGQQLDLDIKCENLGDRQTVLLNALEHAINKNPDNCVLALAPIAERDVQAAALSLQCKEASDNSAKHNIAGNLIAVLEYTIAHARYKPDLRREAVQKLRGSQAYLTADSYKNLINMTKSWLGDETLFQNTTPDWNVLRTNAQASMLSSFFDPSSAKVEWPYGFTYGAWKPAFRGRIEGYWTCGMVNGKNRMGGYVGSRFFVVVMHQNAETLFSEVGNGETLDFVESACRKSLNMLPPASAQFTDPSAKHADNNPKPSIADELTKLADLKKSGALTEEEYQRAKSKILSGI